MDTIIIHYAEIAIKGNNRPWFEKLLITNIQKHLQGLSFGKVKRIFGRLVIQPSSLTESDVKEYTKRLSNIFGISSFSFACSIKQDLEEMKRTISKLIEDSPAKTVRVLTKRSNKNFPINSVQINKELGDYLIKNHQKTIDLVDAELSIHIEIVDNFCYIYKEKIPGLGGLPIGSSGKVIILLSGGIDSPVAAWYMMKRGCDPVYGHFHSHPYTNISSQEKVERLALILSKYKPGSKIYFIPFIDIQKQIMTKTDKKYRVILYRRYMMRIAEIIAKRENAKALVTGEAVGQVASQILSNMASVQDATSMLILRPLIGFDKQEIINKAKEIGTYEISIEPHEDCCSLFIPKHPALQSDIPTLRKFEEGLDNQELIHKTLEKMEKKKFNISGNLLGE